MKKIISLIICLVIVISALFLSACKEEKIYYFETSSVKSEDVVKENGVIIDKNNFPEDVTIKVVKVKEKDRRFKIAKAVFTEATELFVYDISSIRNGVTIDPYQPANVIFPIPTMYSADKYEMFLYSIADNASTEYIEFKEKDNGLYVKLSEMGLFAIVLVQKSGNTSSGTSNNTNTSSQTHINTSSKRPQPIVVTPQESNTSSGTTTSSDINSSSSETTTTSESTTTSSSDITTSTESSTSSSNSNSSPSTSTSKPNDGYTSDYVIER